MSAAGLIAGLVVIAAVTPTPTPVPSVPDPDQVSPGLAGFLTIFILALATVLLVRNMTGRLRRLRYSQPADPPEAPDGDPDPPPQA